MRKFLLSLGSLLFGLAIASAQEGIQPTPPAYGQGVATEQTTSNSSTTSAIKPTPEAYNKDYQLTGEPKQEVYIEGKGKKIIGKYKISEVKHVFLDQNISPGPVDPHQRAIYQLTLAENPYAQYGMRFSIKWSGEGPVLPNLILRLHVKGIMGDVPTQKIITYQFTNFRRGGKWTEIEIVGDEYKALGQLTAWKASLECDNQVLAVKRSFLWRD